MAIEFNYKRAWKEFVAPEFQKLYKNKSIQKAYDKLADEIDHIKQVGASATVTGQSKELEELFDAIPLKRCAYASEIVYYYGHLSSTKTAQNGGLYWKFKDLCTMSIIERGKSSYLSEPRAQIKNELRKYYEHEEGTSYSTEEIPSLVPKLLTEGIVEVIKAGTVNHKPDVFCITNTHMRLSKGMYIDPTVAPCGNCRQPYENHTYETALFVRPLIDSEIKIKACMEKVIKAVAVYGVRLDGFALVK